MGYIKEPAGIDFIVDSSPLSDSERKKISEIIAYYNTTGKKMPLSKSQNQTSLAKKRKKTDA